MAHSRCEAECDRAGLGGGGRAICRLNNSLSVVSNMYVLVWNWFWNLYGIKPLAMHWDYQQSLLWKKMHMNNSRLLWECSSMENWVIPLLTQFHTHTGWSIIASSQRQSQSDGLGLKRQALSLADSTNLKLKLPQSTVGEAEAGDGQWVRRSTSRSLTWNQRSCWNCRGAAPHTGKLQMQTRLLVEMSVLALADYSDSHPDVQT